jgi:hypothetical protein
MDPPAVARPRGRRRPRRWSFGPAPTCADCRTTWPHSARFCGRCGEVLSREPHLTTSRTDPSQRDPRREGISGRRRRLWARASALGPRGVGVGAATVALTGATLLVVIVGTRGPHLETASPADDTTELPDPATPRAHEEARTTVCLEDGATTPACVVPLAPHPVSRGMLATLPPDGVLLALDDEVRRFEVTSGLLMWRTRPFGDNGGGLRVRAAEDAVVVSRPGEVALLEAEDGSVRWLRPLPNPAARAAPRIWMLDGDVFVLDTARVLHALDGQDGQVRWSLDDVSPEVIATSSGLLVNRAGVLGLWRPDTAAAVWSRDSASLAPLRFADEQPVTTPVRLLFGPDLLVPETGETVELRGAGPTTTRVLHDVTLVLHWTDQDLVELTGLGPGGQVRWQRTGLALPCCLASGAPASGARLVLGPVTGPFELLDQHTGDTLGSFHRPGATLEGVAGDLVVWREYERLIGTDLATGEEVLRAWGTVRALEPLLLSGPEGLIHILPDPDR